MKKNKKRIFNVRGMILQLNNGNTFLYVLIAKQTICLYSLKFIKMIISNIYIYSCVNICIYKYVIWPPQTKISGYAPKWIDLPFGEWRRGFSLSSSVSFSITHRHIIQCLRLSSLTLVLYFYCLLFMFMHQSSIG